MRKHAPRRPHPPRPLDLPLKSPARAARYQGLTSRSPPFCAVCSPHPCIPRLQPAPRRSRLLLRRTLCHPPPLPPSHPNHIFLPRPPSLPPACSYTHTQARTTSTRHSEARTLAHRGKPTRRTSSAPRRQKTTASICTAIRIRQLASSPARSVFRRVLHLSSISPTLWQPPPAIPSSPNSK